MTEALGGELLLKNSYPGQGSTFLATFRDSLEISTEPASHNRPAGNERSDLMQELVLSGVKVLSVDDALDNVLPNIAVSPDILLIAVIWIQLR